MFDVDFLFCSAILMLLILWFFGYLIALSSIGFLSAKVHLGVKNELGV